MTKLASIIRIAMYRMLIVFKRFNQNIDLLKIISIDDFKHFGSNQAKEVKNYWKKYSNKYKMYFFRYYTSRTGIFDKRYIPDNLYYSEIDMFFNNSMMSYGVDNKAYYDRLLPNIEKPLTIIRKMNGYYYDRDYNLIQFSDIYEMLESKRYILKPSFDSQGGKGITFFTKDTIADIKDNFANRKDFVVQEVIMQHNDLKSLHKDSINTIRVISLLFDGEIKILSSVLRMGVSGSQVDNASAGGIVVGIDSNGLLKEYAFSSKSRHKYSHHPDSGIAFKGYKVPGYYSVVGIVQKEALRFPNFRLISWDFAIDENEEPLFIEFNLKNGQIDFHQFTNGPLFGDMTDRVLSEVWGR